MSKSRHLFKYGVEYLLYFDQSASIEQLGGLCQEAVHRRGVVLARVQPEFISIIDSTDLRSRVNKCKYIFFETLGLVVDMEKQDEWRKYTVIRALDKEEEKCFHLEPAEEQLISALINKCNELGLKVTERGWYKIRTPV